MAEVTIRELRNHGGDVINRVLGGERLVVTRAGRPVAELRPIGPEPLTADALLRRWDGTPHVDGASLRADLDAVIDPHL